MNTFSQTEPSQGSIAIKFKAWCMFFLLTCTGMFAQTNYTFTPAGATGRYGPTQLQVNAAYFGTNLQGNVTINIQGIQEWTVPATGAYGILAVGAQGFGAFGGRGASMYGEFQLNAGQVLKILVGQAGPIYNSASYNGEYSGGGGSFVVDILNNPMVVAGGGGGSWATSYTPNSDASTSNNGNSGANGTGGVGGAGGTGGLGGATMTSADGGGGLTGNGGGTGGGYSFLNGGLGGTSTYCDGGFGGGAATSSFNNRRGGGGGGYSGGGGTEGGTALFPEGGGGGSFNAGVNQLNVAGANTGDGRVIITRLCNVAIMPSSNPICIGAVTTLSTNATSVTWTGGATTTTISVSPTVTTTYTVTGTGTTGTNNCIASAVVVVTVNPLPVLSIVPFPTVACAGGTSSLTGYGAASASSYSWSNGMLATQVATVNPMVNTTYTLSGTNGYGCVSTNTIMLVINTNSLSVSQNTNAVCRGSSANLAASGAVTYTWSNGSMFPSISISPTVSTIYTVTATDLNNCIISNTLSLTVYNKPTVGITADKTVICKGEIISLTGNGASSYSWSTGASASTVTYTLGADVTYYYSVTGTDNNGCKNVASFSITASKCVGLEEHQIKGSARVFPNPNTGRFQLELSSASSGAVTIEIYNSRGQLLQTNKAEGTIGTFDLSAESAGMYFIKIIGEDGAGLQTIKLVKE